MTLTFSIKKNILLASSFVFSICCFAQENFKSGEIPSQGELRLLQPNYPNLYGTTTASDVKKTLDKVFSYLDKATPYLSATEAKKSTKFNDTYFKQGDYSLVHYTWAVTYSGMLDVWQKTADEKYRDYTIHRINFIAETANSLKNDESKKDIVRHVTEPNSLDEVGALSTAMMQAKGLGITTPKLDAILANNINFLETKQYYMLDGTLARNKPYKNSLWLDDYYMGIPMMLQIAKLKKDNTYYDEAAKQFLLLSGKMFNPQTELFMHGWVADMQTHPEFYWGRANGWVIMAEVELLENLPQNHPSYQKILSIYKKHVDGITKHQSGTGLWHQLIDKHDSYLETTGSAAFTYGIAKGINNGWLDKRAYGSVVLQGWNALSNMVNSAGELGGSCVGTGMAFDPVYYYNRPTSRYAAHGYGIFLMAGAELYQFLDENKFETKDTSVLLFK